MREDNDGNKASFWEHLDVLRGSLWRIIVVGLLAGVAAFFFKEELFAIIFAPKSSDFITYSLFNDILRVLNISGEEMQEFSITLINTELAQQFITHVRMSIYVGLMAICPYIIYELYRFVSPALYRNERKYTLGVVTSGYVMFILGSLVSYFVIFPLTLRFLGTYQVSAEVANEIVLSSYISMFMMLNVMMGIVFEIPIVGWLLARMGIINAKTLIKYRKHAIVVLLIIAAVITPTADVVTLLLVMCPMYMLYEMTILLIRISRR